MPTGVHVVNPSISELELNLKKGHNFIAFEWILFL